MSDDCVSKIRILDYNTVAKIAAGEVIQNACNVIKELIENAIDAGANEIEIIIENGGKSLIKVIDNGSGMSEKDLKLSIKNHATSKFENLDNITTLGFRGEALYSIAKSSKLSIITKQFNNLFGYILKEDETIEPCAANDGTTIIVRDLLSKIPVRQKFLKSDSQETYLIDNMVKTYQLGFPNISFIFKNNNKNILLPNKINTNERQFKINFQHEHFLLDGNIYVEYKYIYIFVNNRPVYNKKLSNILKEIYKGITGNDRVGMLLRISCPANFIDVNMHPAKIEIRFLDNTIFDLFTNATKNSMEITINQQLNSQLPNVSQNSNSWLNNSYNQNNSYNSNKSQHWSGAKCFGGMHPHLNQKQDSFSNLQEESLREDLIKEWGNLCGVLSENKQHKCKDNIDMNFGSIIGQIFNKYLICELDNDLILIDQHAASERIWAEKLKTEKVQLQQLIQPLKIIVDPSYEEKIMKISEIMDIALIDKTLIVKAIPTFINEDTIEESIKNYIASDSNDPMWIIHEILHEKGCKSAIKTGQRINNDEAMSLLKTLQNTQHGQFCNHGRPTFIKINIRELDKRFLRT